jgi:hypothetical protein
VAPKFGKLRQGKLFRAHIRPQFRCSKRRVNPLIRSRRPQIIPQRFPLLAEASLHKFQEALLLSRVTNIQTGSLAWELHFD